MKQNTAPEISEIELEPYLDMELFMILSQNKRLDRTTADIVEEYWPLWRERIQARRIVTGKQGYVVVWLDEYIENEVASAWDSSPSRAFTMNTLAQAMLMATVRDLVPEAAASHCAPVPKPTASLKSALETLGLSWTEHNTLTRQYAMLTYAPYKGGCPVCFLNKTCPNANTAR